MIYAFGQYELDTRVYELRSGGSIRDIEPQVFDVLAYLVRNRDRVVSKDEMLEKLWPDRFVSETTLTSRLKEARKAVGDTGQLQSVIRTQRGRGYRFVAPVEERGDPASSRLIAWEPGTGIVPAEREAGTAVVDLAGNLPTPEIGTDTRFVGRRSELDRLGRILRTAMGGKRQLVFVTGEGGVGKTTLVDAFLSEAVPGSALLVARGQCVEYRGSSEPYMPLLDALSRLSRRQGGEPLIELLKREAPSWIIQMPSLVSDAELAALRSRSAASGERMVRELGMMIDRLTSVRPLILILEDLHWSDYATLDAIDLIARQTLPARLMIIGTWRPSDVKAARHPVYALSQELRVRGLCDVVALPLLETMELELYLRLRFGEAGFIPGLARILQARTGGNALFVGNLVDSWIERGLIHRLEHGWTLGVGLSSLEKDVPDSLQQLIEMHVAELDPGQQRLLETASVIGRSFPVALAAATIPAADDDLERDCERLASESGILRSDGTAQWGDGSLTSVFSFMHDLYVDALYERTSASRRARIHQRIGLALERAWEGRRNAHASELALHFLRAHDRDRGPSYLQMAAEQAIERNAYREAVELLSSALELLEGAPRSAERDATELQVRSRLAPALVATRGWVDQVAEENYLRARELAETLGDVGLLSQILYGLANMYEYRGEYEIAEKITKERIALDVDATGARALESHELLTCSLLHQGRYRESVQHGERAISAFSANGAWDLDPERLSLLVQAYGWMSASLHFAGRADEALEYSAEALRLSAESGNEPARASAQIQAAFLRFYRREPEECDELAGAGGAVARELRFPFHVACARVLQGWAKSTRGEWDDAIREIRAGIRTSEALGARMDLPLFYAILADALSRTGDAEAALEAIEKGLGIIARGRTFFYGPELYRQRGDILRLLRDRQSDATSSLERALEMAQQQECSLFALRAAKDLAAMDRETWIARLRAIHSGFEQGLDTGDIVEVRELLADQ